MADHNQEVSGSTPDEPPPPPVPASDPNLFSAAGPAPAVSDQKRDDNDSDVPSPRLAALAEDIFGVTPLAALQLLGAGIEALVRITGDIPPTPPPPGEQAPTNMRGMQAEKEVIVRTLSTNSLARLREQAEADEAAARRRREKAQDTQSHDQQQQQPPGGDGRNATPPRDAADHDDDGGGSSSGGVCSPATPGGRSRLPPTPPPARPLQMEIDGVHLRPSDARAAAAITTPPPGEPYTVIGANSQPLNVQHSAISRKFYSKKTPPIGISEYLLRLHRFCPMSTGVYLATSLYIYRLAVAEKAIAVTRRNAHRLLLAGLRVAMKALEDLSYAHAKMARVGGVSEAELARLEINFCFLAGFELAVCPEDMRQHWVLMKSGRAVGPLDQDGTASVLASMEGMRIPTRAAAS